MTKPNLDDSGVAATKPIETTTPGLEARRSSGRIDLNRASEGEIAEIDMIGKKLAHAIVSARDARGGFGGWDELKQVPGLDAMKIAELQRAAQLDD